MKLNEAIKVARNKATIKQQAHDRELRCHQERKLKRVLDEWGIEGAEVAGNIVSAQGIHLKADFAGGKIQAWQVMGHCRKCLQSAWSAPIFERERDRVLASIGEMQNKFFSDTDHVCDADGPDAPEAFLISCLKSLVKEIIEEQ